jgi:multidrug efflux pump subunit AcrA (membrane-fusion protein)
MKFIKYITAVFIFSLALFACSGGNEEAENNMESITPVTITHISIEPVSKTIELNATTINKKNIVRSSMSGIIENVEINVGDNISRNQILFKIITKEAAALEKNATTDTILLIKGMISVRASKNGTVSVISHQKGDYVQEGDELAEISDRNSLVFILDVPFELRNIIKSGSICDIILPDNQTITGKIVSSLPIMDINSQIENFVIVPLKGIFLPENLIVRVRIIESTKRVAMVLPKDAILTNETQTNFWVMKLINDSIAIKIPVQKDIEENNIVEIIDPVFSTNDRIILNGNYGLPDTAKIRIKK